MRARNFFGVLCGFAFLFSLSVFVSAAPTLRKKIDFKADVLRYEARNADSVIVVFKEDAEKTRSKLKNKGSGLPGFKGIKSFKKILSPTSKLSSKVTRAKKSGKTPSTLESQLDRMHVGQLQDGVDIVDMIEELEASPLVDYAEPNYKVEALGKPNDPAFDEVFPLNNTGQPTRYIVPGASLAWTNGAVDADMDWLEAWTNSVPGQAFPTNEIVVAVIDTGVDYTHPDMTNQMWRNSGEIPGNGIDDDGNGYVDDVFGYDFYYDDGDPMDIESEGGSHGTHVAGTIAAEANNGVGICGVNPHAKIMAVKFLGEGGGYTADAISSIIYAVDNGATVLNNSWGGGGWERSLQGAIDYAVSNGVVFLAAAGNNGSDGSYYPAAYRGSIAVSSMDWNDEKADYSNYGTHVDIAAHGSDILSLQCSTYSEHPGLTVEPGLLVYHGTSMACPNAAGAISLLMAKYPGRHPSLYESVLKSTADTDMLGNSVNKNYEGKLGAGRINVNRLLNEDAEAGFVVPTWCEDTSLATPGQDYRIAVDVGVWSNEYTDVSVWVTSLTDGISINTEMYSLGSLPPYAVTNISTNVFLATIASDSSNEYERLQFELRADGKTLGTAQLSVYLVNGNSRAVLVDDFDGDGTNEIAAIYYGYAMMYNNLGELRWMAHASLGYGNWTHSLCAGDITGDGFKELIVEEHRWLMSDGPAALFAYKYDGQAVDGFPLTLHRDDSTHRAVKRGFGEPTLVDVDEDGVLDIVCNMDDGENPGIVRAYNGSAELLWETSLRYKSSCPPSAGDLDGDGFEEIVVWNNPTMNDYWVSSIFILNTDGSVRKEIPLEDGLSTPQFYNMHFRDRGGVTALGDLDGDGDLEIICYATGYDGNRKILAFHHDGSVVDGWPIAVDIGTTPKLADLDNDGDVEVIISARKDGSSTALYVYDGDGTLLPDFPLPYNWKRRGMPYVEDVSGNGEPNFIYSSISTNRYPGIYVSDMNTNGLPGLDPFIFEYDFIMQTLEDTSICVLNPTNRSFVLAISHEMLIVDTDYAVSNMNIPWPMRHQNPRRTKCSIDRSDPFYRCTFHADQQFGISNITVNFSSVLWEFDETNAWFSWDYDNDGTVDETVFGVSTSSYDYATIGDYSVSLTVSNSAGETFTRTRSNYVHVLQPVVADFSAIIQTASVPIRVRFTDLSQNEPRSWAWDLDGDGYIDSTVQNPEYYYNETGIYNVSLTVSNDFGAWGKSSDTMTKSAFMVLTNEASTDIKYVATNGLSLYPYKNWNEAATTLKDALDIVKGHQTVLIGDGTYRVQDLDRSADLNDGICSYTIDNHRDHLTVRSQNGPEKTSIEGWKYSPSHRGLTIENSDSVTIEGITFANCNAQGGGIFCGDGAEETTIRNCVFTNNSSGTSGGSGVYVEDAGVHIDNCQFLGNKNRSGALFIRNSAGDTALVENSTFKWNSNESYIYAAAVYFDNRSAYWVYPGETGDFIMRNCLIAENTGWYSIVYGQPEMLIENCTIVDNVTLAGNSATLRSGHHDVMPELEGENQGPWTIRNTIVRDNFSFGSDFLDQPDSPMSFSYCCTTGTVSGTGNTTADPRLSGIPGDFHITLGSSCIDAGSDQSWMGSANDVLDNDPRVINGRSDIGCDEYQAGCSISATPAAGTSTLHVAFSSVASSFAGTITNYLWNFGDGSPSASGASLTDVNHDYSSEGSYLATITVYDDAGHAGSNGLFVVVDDTGPVIDSVFAPDATNVVITFDEALLSAPATTLTNYTIDTVTILSALHTADNEVTLSVTEMSDGLASILTVSEMKDIYGNKMDGISTQAFVYVDRYGDNRLLFDFGYDAISTTNTGWNNPGSGHEEAGNVVVTDAVNARGGDTSIDLRITKDFYTPRSEGVATNILYPITAQKDNAQTENYAKFKLEDLSQSNTYDLVFFNSMDLEYNFTTEFWVGEEMVSLNAYKNTENTVMLHEISPDETGAIEVMVKEATSSVGGYIGVLEVRPRTPSIQLSTNGTDVVDGTPSVSVLEGGSTTVYMRLAEEPSSLTTVIVERVSGDLDLNPTLGSETTFDSGDWQTWKEIRINAAQDDDSATGTATIQCRNAKFVSRYISAEEIEDDVDVVANTSYVLVPENSGANFTLQLTAPPDNTVTVTVEKISGDSDIDVVSSATLLFDSEVWNVPQTVSLRADTDADALNGTATIRCAAAAISSVCDVSAIEQDGEFVVGYSCYHDMDADGGRAASDHANVSHGRTHGTAYDLLDIQSGNTASEDIVFTYFDAEGEKSNALAERTPTQGSALPVSDAYAEFDGIVNAARAYELDDNANEYGRITFTNLVPGARYTLKLYMNRDARSGDHTIFTLGHVSEFVGNSSAGVGDNDDADEKTYEIGADNTDSGYLVSWCDILPEDGGNSFQVDLTSVVLDRYVYMPQAIKLTRQSDGTHHAPDIQLSTSTVDIAEASYQTFSIKPAIQPTSEVTFVVSKVLGDTDIIVSGSDSFVFNAANWTEWKTVTLWSGSDPDDIDGSASFECSATNWNTATLLANEVDNDDLSGPRILNVIAPDDDTVHVFFDEEVDATTAGTAGNYAISGGITVSSASRDGSDYRKVTLSVSTMAANSYQLTVNQVKDTQENVIAENTQENFRYSGMESFYLNTLDVDPEWITSGLWEFGVPQGGGGTNDGGYGCADPTSGYTGTNVYGYNLEGHCPLETPPKYLTSTAIDCSDYQDIQLNFRRWLNASTYYNILDNIQLQVSTDGISWTQVWKLSEGGLPSYTYFTENQWSNVVYDISNVADGQATVYLRWLQDTSKNDVKLTTGWNIDDIELEGVYVGNASAGGIEVSTSSVTVPEGGNNTFDLRLYSEPINATTVTVSHVGGDSDIQLQGTSSFVFETNTWNQWQTATLQAAEDIDWVDGVATVRCSAVDLENVDITATEDDNETDPAYALPWEEPFEERTLGDLAGQHGWIGGGTVQTGTVHTGTKALSLQSATASHTFDGAQNDVVIEFQAKFIRGAATPSDTGTAVAIFSIDTNGYLVAYSNETAITVTSTNLSDDWHSFKAQLDYTAQTWTMSVDDTLLVDDFAFYSAQSDFTKIAFKSGSEAAYLDEIYVINQTVDTDDDGIPDTWEEIHYNGITNAVATNLCANGINTILEAYIAGLNPTNASSIFEVSNVRNILHWSGTNGRIYTIYWTSNLLNGFDEPLKTNLPWTAMPYTDTNHSAESEGFYKLEVELEK